MYNLLFVAFKPENRRFDRALSQRYFSSILLWKKAHTVLKEQAKYDIIILTICQLPWLYGGMNMNVEKILSEMTLEEKASLCSGGDFWHTKALKRFDIEPIMLSDGPHGLRKTNRNHVVTGADDETAKAVCFPAACATASSFDRTLLEKMGKALGEECQAEDIAVILGPGVNIKRSPLCGRNFEYFSEDPYLASQQAAALIKGIQSKGVGTSVKHFACNNQETRRMAVSANVDERTLHEIYLSAFESVIKNAKPWTVMCSYNRVNGTYSSQNKYLLTDILRDKWGFDGLVMSDWGAVDEREKGVAAGLDLQMPSAHGKTDAIIVEAVKKGELDEKLVDECARNVLKLYDKYKTNHKGGSWDADEHHELSRRIAAECAVLLKNKDDILPLDKNQKICFIGAFAKEPRFQGGGSSHIDCTQVTSALEAVKEYCDVEFALGFEAESSEPDEKLISEAEDLAKKNDVAVIFAGLPDSFEFEGGDRKHMRMPDCQCELIERIAAVNKNVVVVLHNGSPMEMPWVNKAKGILEMYLAGQACGGAACDLLFGKVNPSGKLAETFPIRHEDTPAYIGEFGEGDNVYYNEGLYVGYRWYDKRKMDVLFPFGYGLSYTKFEYSDIKLSADEINADGELTVSVTVKNVGKRSGKEVVQLYVRDRHSSVDRPVRELKGYEKVSLEAGESKKVFFRLDKRAFAYYSTAEHDWVVEDGRFDIEAGASSRDIRQSAFVYINNGYTPRVKFTINSLIMDILAYPTAAKEFFDFLKQELTSEGMDIHAQRFEELTDDMLTVFSDMSVRTTMDFLTTKGITREKLTSTIERLNVIVNEGAEE